MRSRSTTICRSSGLARLGLAAAGLALAGLAGPVTGQSSSFTAWPPLEWAAQESLDSHQDAHDEGVDIVYWLEEGSPDKHWIYVTGWVTEMNENGGVKGTRFATFKYDATDDGSSGTPTPTEEAYFPLLTTSLQSGDTYKAVAMDIDPTTGDIYVTGQGPDTPGGTDQDYVVIKYAEDLSQEWVSSYDGPVSGEDIPADIAVDPDNLIVAVTGTSPGSGTGLDIATVAWYTDDSFGMGKAGTQADDHWPSDGVRRYNNDAEDGDDRAVELWVDIFDEPEIESGALTAIVLGTSYNGSSKLDDYVTHQWSGVSTSVSWDVYYDNGGDDVAAGLAVDDAGAYVYVTGSSEGASDIDYATVSYFLGFEEWVEREDYVGEDDYPRDIHLVVPTSGDRQVWVTGAGFDGTYSDVFTVRYLDDLSGSISGLWAEGFGYAPVFEYGYGMTVFEDEPYIAGSQGGSTSDRMLALHYIEDSPYTQNWNRIFAGPYVGVTSNEGRGVVAAVVQTSDTDRSVYVVGVSTESGEGRQFTTLRYKEE